MTEIVIASRDGILRAPSGEQFRLVRGRTLADARHPGVVANPNDFMPVEVELSYDEPEATGDVSRETELAAEAAYEYREQLAAIADVLAQRGLIHPETDTESKGWLARAVADALAEMLAANGDTTPAEEPIAPPAPIARKTRAKTVVPDAAS